MDILNTLISDPTAILGIVGGLVFGFLTVRQAAKPDTDYIPDEEITSTPATETAPVDADVAGAVAAETTVPASVTDTEPGAVLADVPEVPEPEVAEPEPVSPPTPALDIPEAGATRMGRLRSRLAKSGAFGQALLSIFARGDLSVDDWEEIEDSLVLADLGRGAADELVDYLKTQAKVLNTSDPAVIRAALRDKLLEMVDGGFDRSLNITQADADGQLPGSVLVVGVNGAGKTTLVGKLARLLVAEGRSVVLGAADTFRAAAADQLQTWGERVGVPVVRSDREQADPASVAFEAVGAAVQTGADVVVVDTAGRLQNKTDLMDELGKVKRVMSKQVPITETLLVLDATIGQNSMVQARVFAEVVDVTGIVLTKLDGSAKGGIVVSVQRELGVPVKFVGLGEGADDLAPFDPEVFVDAIVGK